MSLRMDFTKDEFLEIKEKAMLNEELSTIFEMKIKGYTNTEIAFKLHLSDRTFDRRLRTLKKKIMRVI